MRSNQEQEHCPQEDSLEKTGSDSKDTEDSDDAVDCHKCKFMRKKDELNQAEEASKMKNQRMGFFVVLLEACYAQEVALLLQDVQLLED